jgi:uncharacterized protein involved in exopolysaccharide biosynthesis
VTATLRNELNDVARRQAALSEAGDTHPLLPALRAEALELSRQIDAEVQRIVSGLQNAAQIAEARASSLERALKDASGQVELETQARVKLAELQRSVAARTGDYETLLSRSRIASAEEALFSSESRTISPAIVPDEPSFPQKKLLTVVAFIFGLGLGTVGAIIRDARLQQRGV